MRRKCWKGKIDRRRRRRKKIREERQALYTKHEEGKKMTK